MITICCQIFLIALYILLWCCIWYSWYTSGLFAFTQEQGRPITTFAQEIIWWLQNILEQICTKWLYAQNIIWWLNNCRRRGDTYVKDKSLHKISSDDPRIAWNRYAQNNSLHNLLSDVSKIAKGRYVQDNDMYKET